MKRIREVIKIVCVTCLGAGRIINGHGRIDCPTCKGTGEVDSVVWRIVPEEEDEHAHALRQTGALE